MPLDKFLTPLTLLKKSPKATSASEGPLYQTLVEILQPGVSLRIDHKESIFMSKCAKLNYVRN